MHVHDDIAIIKLVLAGRKEAYGLLVNRYQGYVFTLCLRYVHEREVAEEVAQDVFVKAYRNLADFRGQSKFSTWLYTIVHSTCLTQLRKRKADTILPGDEHLEPLNAGEHTVQQTESHTRKKVLNEAIGHLPEAEAEALTLYYLAEQTIDEIAIITGTTAGNVKVRLHRARQKLKGILQTARYAGELR